MARSPVPAACMVRTVSQRATRAARCAACRCLVALSGLAGMGGGARALSD